MRTTTVRTIMPALLLAFMCLLLSSCSFLGCETSGCEFQESKVTGLTISPATATVNSGDTLYLHASAALENGNQLKLSASDVR